MATRPRSVVARTSGPTGESVSPTATSTSPAAAAAATARSTSAATTPRSAVRAASRSSSAVPAGRGVRGSVIGELLLQLVERLADVLAGGRLRAPDQLTDLAVRQVEH